MIQTDLNVQFGFAPTSAFTGDRSTCLLAESREDFNWGRSIAATWKTRPSWPPILHSVHFKTRKPNQIQNFLDNRSFCSTIVWHLYEHPYCTDSDILFLILLTNVLFVSCFGWMRLLNAPKCKCRILNGRNTSTINWNFTLLVDRKVNILVTNPSCQIYPKTEGRRDRLLRSGSLLNIAPRYWHTEEERLCSLPPGRDWGHSVQYIMIYFNFAIIAI